MIRHFFLNSNWLLFGSASKYPPSARSGEQMKGFFPHRPHEWVEAVLVFVSRTKKQSF